MDLTEALADKTATLSELTRHVEQGQWDDPRNTLRTLWTLIQTAESTARTVVEMMRQDQTASWSEIANEWGGITRQAAQQKWG